MNPKFQFILDWISRNWRYLVGVLAIAFLIAIGKDYVLNRCHSKTPIPQTVISNTPPTNLTSDANYIICIYDQKECCYNNIGKTIFQIIEICGKRDKCDIQ